MSVPQLKSRVMAAAKGWGATWDAAHSTMDAPVGFIWSGSGNHGDVTAFDQGGSEESCWQSALDDMKYGLDICDAYENGECDTCNSAE